MFSIKRWNIYERITNVSLIHYTGCLAKKYIKNEEEDKNRRY